MLQKWEIGKKSWQIVVIHQIRQSFFPSKVFYCTVYGATDSQSDYRCNTGG